MIAGFVLGYAWWATGLRPFSSAALVAVEAAGLGALILGARRRIATGATSDHRITVIGIAAWAALIAALIGWQLAAYFQHPRSQHPTLSSLANSVLDPHPVRAAAFGLWLWGAARLARRP